MVISPDRMAELAQQLGEDLTDENLGLTIKELQQTVESREIEDTQIVDMAYNLLLRYMELQNTRDADTQKTNPAHHDKYPMKPMTTTDPNLHQSWGSTLGIELTK